MDRMKLKPIKVLAKGTLDDYDKKELVLRVQALQNDAKNNEDFIKEQIGNYEVTIKELNSKIREENNRVLQLEKSVSIFTTDDYKVRQVLKLYAQGKSIGTCFTILTEMKRIDISFETIKNLITALESKELDIEYIKYYEDEIKAFSSDMVSYEERNRIQKLRKLDEFGVIIEQYMANLRDEGFDDSEFEKTDKILSLMKAYTSIVESSSKIMKGLGANTLEIKQDVEQVNTERFEDKAIDAFLNFDDANISVEEVN